MLSIIYGRLFKIVSKYNIDGTTDVDSTINTTVDVFVDLSTDLIQNYFYVLYIKHKNYLIDGKSSYRLSDWKRENSELANQFEETKVELGSKFVSWMKNINLVKIKLITKGNINIDVPSKRFSFNDIHLNLEKVRW